MAKDLKYSTLLDVYGGMLTDKQRDMIDLYYNDDLSLSEIADNEGISRQGVRDAIKRGEESLDELEDKIGVLKMIKENEEKLAYVTSQCDEIIQDCRTYTTTKSVIEKLERVKAVINS
ncbi:MAG: DNA-binding protein [Oscillospiraceae bacterium]|nr:DNA-binding protein [Ruminococcus sp.]MCD8344339.1 DNA-binding protein [Oscillospiraceae bacterium]